MPAPQPTPPPPLDAETGLPAGYALKPDWEVTPRLAKQYMLGPTPPVLLDCRRDEEWAFNRIPGAVHIPLSDIEKRFEELEAEDGSREHEILVYCHHGRRSMMVTAELRARGFPNVRSIAGGIDLWAIDVDPTIPRYGP